MKKLLLALAIAALPTVASAQCNGVFPTNTVCGNITGGSNTPRPTNPSAFQGSAGGSNGQIQYNNAGALAGVPVTAADVAANRILGPSDAFVDRKPLYPFTMPTPFTTLSAPQYNGIQPQTNLGTSGPGSTTMVTTPSDVFHNITRVVVLNSLYAFVDPAAGSDANIPACAQATPCATLQACITNCTATNIVGVATAPFLPFSFNGATAARAWHRLTFTGPATIMITGAPYTEAPNLVFAASGNIYCAPIVLAGSAAVQRWSYSDTYDAGTGNLIRFPHYASKAALNTAGASASVFGWWADSTEVCVAFFGLNVNTFKSKMRAYYTDTSGDAAITLLGGVNLLIDTPYQLNLDGINIQYYNSGASVPALFIEGRGMLRQFVPLGNGVHGEGGFAYISGMDCIAASGDCFNFDPSSTGATGMAIAHNVRGWYAGDTATFGTGITANKNGWSAHGGVNDIIVGSSFGRNWGPNIANTVLAANTNYSWLVGVETTTAASGDAGIGFYGNAGQPTAIRQAWVDTCSTLAEVISLYAEESTITVKQTNCALNVVSTTANGGTISDYVRNAP